MTAQNNKQLSRLTSLLKDLFQLDQPELDFGLYKIMHAKSVQITQFLENDLLKEVEKTFGARDGANAEQLITQAKARLLETLGDTALDDNGQLNAAFATLPAGKKYLQDMAAAKQVKDTLSADAEIYDHLYRFFERYYDNGDFLSRRYYARENDTRAAPYSVPYDGREVYLHWANKDQYYIKSGENFSHYSFDLTEAANKLMQASGQGLGLDVPTANVHTNTTGNPLKVHLRIADAQEGEHGNIKTAGDQKREFIPLLERPADINAAGELVLNFEYKVLPGGYPVDEATDKALRAQYGFSNKGDMPTHWMADVFLKAIAALSAADPAACPPDYARLLGLPAPTDKQPKRPLLAKYISLYTARNTMDYFIHKDLGGFLRRELDFYIKNEVMRLDDIESAEAPKVEQILGKIKVLRRIAHQLIAFLAQLEDFQKKLWLKKKFVTEVNYCITLDRVPERLYPAIVANDAQRQEWVTLFAIDEIKGDMATAAYTAPLTVEFLKANPFLLMDTALFDEAFKADVLSQIENLDAQCDGVLIHSENFNALNFSAARLNRKVKLVITDPPYNTKTDTFPYKDSYKHASWLSMMHNRTELAKDLLAEDGIFFHHIDENEHYGANTVLTEIFGSQNRVVDIVWKNSSKNGESFISMQHEYIVGAAKNAAVNKGVWLERKEGLEEIYKAFDGFWREHGTDRKAIHQAALDFYKSFPDSNPITDSSHYSWMDAKGVYFPGDISKPANGYYYEVLHPVTRRPCKKPAGGWRFIKETMLEKISKDEIHFGNDETTIPNNKVYLSESENQGLTSIKYKDGRVASNLLKDMFGFKDPFKNPKDVELTQRLIKSLNSDPGVILDYFAGSGTVVHAVLDLIRQSQKRTYLAVEMGTHFDDVLIPRIKKASYSKDWKDGKPVTRDGISHCFKYLRLESYEDTLNNLVVKSDVARDHAVENNPELRSAYLLNYWLDVETQGSPSLLNVQAFADPTNYVMHIKKPGSEAQALQRVDLIETFNWLLGLWVEHLAAPQAFSAEFAREVDKDLPQDQNTRLVCTRLKVDADGPHWFRLVEGYTLKVPGDDSTRQKTLIVWRKLTDNREQDNAVLQKFLMEKLGISPRERTYDVIYVNGSHTLPNPLIDGEQTKVRLIEEAFHTAMWAQAGV